MTDDEQYEIDRYELEHGEDPDPLGEDWDIAPDEPTVNKGGRNDQYQY